MARPFAGGTYSARARLVAIFLVLAVALGGGGSPNPTTELLLEISFAVCAAVWLWLPSEWADGDGQVDRLVFVLVAIPLVIPIMQLLPLPPSLWTGLPARQDEFASLSLVGREHSWRPISLSPSRTLAALLAIVPAVGCAYAVARLKAHERRLIVATIVVMALASALLGVLQLFAGDRGISLYSQFHVGWITGFQANRNSEADVLMIGLLALATLAAPYLFGGVRKLPMKLDRRAVLGMTLGLALLLLAATLMTGSRAGTMLISVAVVLALAIAAVSRTPRQDLRGTPFAIAAALALLGGVAIAYLAYAGHTAVGRVAERFADAPGGRLHIWQDTWFALGQYWPVGFGMGGFEPAMLPAERLEFLDAAIPNRAHNDFLELGLEAGVMGYIMLAAAVLVCFTMAYKSWRYQPARKAQVLFAMGVLFVISLHSFVDYPARRIVVADRKISLGRLEAGRIGVRHRMAAASKLARELHLERMSRVVGNENSHWLAARLSRRRTGVHAPPHRRSTTTQGGKIACGFVHSLRTYPGRRALQAARHTGLR
jgi:O-antigen ligase